VLGTCAGVAVATAILGLALPPAAIIAVVVILQIGAELFVGRNYALALMFVTPLALLMVELAHHMDATTLLRDRAIETVLGAMTGIAITVIEHAVATRRSSTRGPAGTRARRTSEQVVHAATRPTRFA
jgi:hypothetical protein